MASKYNNNYYHSLPGPGSSVSESVTTQDTVEVDESLFQDLEDLELEGT